MTLVWIDSVYFYSVYSVQFGSWYCTIKMYIKESGFWFIGFRNEFYTALPNLFGNWYYTIKVYLNELNEVYT